MSLRIKSQLCASKQKSVKIMKGKRHAAVNIENIVKFTNYY